MESHKSLMAIRDNQLDDAIALVLETETILTVRQKQAAWERLRDQAVQQVILAPYAIPPYPPVARRSRLFQAAIGVARVLAVLLTDDNIYHRAAASRPLTGITHTISGDIFIHYYPLRPIYRHAI
jgi:hypothetical protein